MTEMVGRDHAGPLQPDYVRYANRWFLSLSEGLTQNIQAETPAFGQVLASIRDGIDRIEELAHVIFCLALEDALPERLDSVRSRG
ncbi:hypothetical protein ABZV75_09845 [Streptomyces flaveolus]|uniref:hypothetical protein n=1 Tax=Streptomyces flaveolus TaxID=67297 RepID=UPI0033A91F57